MHLTVFKAVDGVLQAEDVSVPTTKATAGAALRALGLPATVTIANGSANVDLASATDIEVAEIVYTLTQFPTVTRVDVAGHSGLTRADEASFVPPILIESPGAGATVPATFHVRGSASVFEGTLVIELVAAGKTVVHQSVTASTGAPDRGTFDETLQATVTGPAEIVAFSPSAADGSPQHEVTVRVTLQRTP
jgi:hypothetical protein